MKRMLLGLCVLLGGCICQNEVDEVVVDNTLNTIDEITVCTGLREKECLETMNKVKDILPNELQNTIVDTTDFIEIYVGDKYNFLKRMSREKIHTDRIAYSGITGYGYSEHDKTVVYAVADDYVLAHELAHAYEYSYWYDGTKDNPSSSAEWQHAYETEYISQYGTTSVMEFYAECFAMYFRSPKMLQKLCPIAYDLLDKDFGDME